MQSSFSPSVYSLSCSCPAAPNAYSFIYEAFQLTQVTQERGPPTIISSAPLGNKTRSGLFRSRVLYSLSIQRLSRPASICWISVSEMGTELMNHCSELFCWLKPLDVFEILYPEIFDKALMEAPCPFWAGNTSRCPQQRVGRLPLHDLGTYLFFNLLVGKWQYCWLEPPPIFENRF